MHEASLRTPLLALALLLLLPGWLGGCGHPAGGVQPQPAAPSPPPASAPSATPQPALPQPAFGDPSLGGAAASIADIAERVTPSVVSISSTRVRKGPQAPPFWPFFGPWGAPRERREQGLGSGVIVRAGVIVTNSHVVAEADEIGVTSHDGREFSVEVVGTDPKSDLAVLRLLGDSSGLKPLELGDSSRLRLGDVVLAIGNPFGVGQTVTMGIVSAKGRADVGIIDYEDFIQTDAAINPGNSGGALVDMEGKLVGINTAILSRTGGSQGIGFAIPSNMARPIVESLLRHGKVVRGWLGVSIQDITPDLAKALGLGTTTGVLISDVGPDTPASRAGLKRGDVVLKVSGDVVDSTGRLRNLIASSGASSRVTVEVLRKGKKRNIEVELGVIPGSEAGPTSPKRAPGGKPSTLDGLTLSELTPENRRRYQIPSDVTHGVVITGVQRGSTAAAAGLRPGDVLLQVRGQKVTSVRRFEQLWRKAKGKTALLIYRRGRVFYLPVDR